MTPLASEIYKLLLRRLRTKTPSITYGELAAQVSRKFPTHHRSPKLHAALGELTLACQARQLPCLPAIVWSSTLQRPSDGYYPVAHPRVRSEDGRVAAWEREHQRVVSEVERFPSSLEA